MRSQDGVDGGKVGGKDKTFFLSKTIFSSAFVGEFKRVRDKRQNIFIVARSRPYTSVNTCRVVYSGGTHLQGGAQNLAPKFFDMDCIGS